MLGTIGAVLGAKTVAALPAKAPDAGGLYTWLTGSPVRIILFIVGASVVIGSLKGRLGKAVLTVMIACLGLFVMFGDVAMKGIATWLGSYFS